MSDVPSLPHKTGYPVSTAHTMPCARGCGKVLRHHEEQDEHNHDEHLGPAGYEYPGGLDDSYRDEKWQDATS